MNVYLKDGNSVELPEGSSVLDLAQKLSEGLARVANGGIVNGDLKDLREPLKEGDQVNIVTFDSAEGKHAFWHSSSHILAQAVKRLYPEAKLAIGPAIDNGFYYDIDLDGGLEEGDLEKIEAEMKKIVKEALPIERFELPRDKAIELMKEMKEDYKVELINDLPEDTVLSFYKQGEFVDLCAGPHVLNTKAVKSFKLTSLAGAYWRGSEKNKMLTRIYGISFTKKADLDEYLQRLEEAKARDHRKIGKEMGIYAMMEEAPGFPFFLPNGMKLRNTLLEYWREIHVRENYDEINTPLIMSRKLWEQSGHWEHYEKNMYTTEIDDADFAIKPMNCPGSILVYRNDSHSYRDLPLRMAEIGLVHRHEKSGALHGLMRVRSFNQDDAHIYLTPDQVKDEIKNVVSMIDEVYKKLGFNYHIELSTRPEDSMGSDEDWENATSALEEAMNELGLDYRVNPGDGAFYGPKLDFHLEDTIGRTWQCGTIQLDFQMPQRFDIDYIGADGEKHHPIMIHRVLFGSIERFIAILIEHFAGKFPLWLAPEQVRVMSISERFVDYADEVRSKLKKAGIRVTLDDRDDKIGYKIRQAQLEKVPYMLVIGAREEEEKIVSVRMRDGGDAGQMNLDELIRDLKEKINTREL